MNIPTQLEALLQRWQQGREQGRHLTPEELCADCPELQTALAELIAQRQQQDSSLESTADADLPSAVLTTDILPPPLPSTQRNRNAPEQLDPDAIPEYLLLSELGRGGMGVVYKARHLPLNRLVAVKWILPGMAGLGERRRFLAEARTIAALKHPHIVQIFDIGERCDQPYFALEFCAGGSLDRLLSKRRGQSSGVLAARPAAALVRALAEALQVVHEAGIIHRDIKPGNVLLERQAPADGLGSQDDALTSLGPRLTDFGLARRVEPGSGLTQTGQVLGTPSYMAPEQALGSRDIGPAADIYALGGLLYECLTARPPFVGDSVLNTLHLVVNEDVVPPRRLNPSVPRDLETLILRCLEKEPTRRPPSARYLAEELGRFLEGRPLLSRPISAAHRLTRWTRRNRALASTLLLAVLALLLVVGLSLAFAVREHWYSGQLRQALFQASTRIAENHLDRARGQGIEGDERLLWLARALQAVPPENPTLERHLRRELGAWSAQLHRPLLQCRQSAGIRYAVLDPSGQRLLVADDDQRVRLWDLQRGEPIAPGFVLPAPPRAVHFDPHGRPLVVAAHNTEAYLFDGNTGQQRAGPFRHPGAVQTAALSPDGRLLLIGCGDHLAHLWEVGTGQRIGQPISHESPVLKVAFHPAGRWLATATLGGQVQVFATDTLRPRFPESFAPADKGPAVALSFAAADRLAIGFGKSQVFVLDVATGLPIGPPIVHRLGSERHVWAVALSSNGRTLLTGGEDGSARLWDLDSGEPIGQSLSHQEEVRVVQVTQDGRRAITAGLDRMIRLWNLADPGPLATLAHGGELLTAAVSVDGDLLATGGTDGTVRLWNLPLGTSRGEALPLSGSVHMLAFASQGQTLLGADGNGLARGWNLGASKLGRFELRHDPGINDAAWRPDGSHFATAGIDGKVQLWQADTAAVRASLVHEGEVNRVMFDPTGRWLLTAASDRKVRLWEVQELLRGNLQPSASWSHEAEVHGLAVSADGHRAVSGGDDREAQLWVLPRTGRPTLVQRLGHGDKVRTAAFAPDGRWLATGSHDHTARLWNAQTGLPHSRSLPHSRAVLHLAFSTDSELLATADAAGRVRLWDTELGRPVGPDRIHQGAVTNVLFTPGGRHLVTASQDGKARLWVLPTLWEGEAAGAVAWAEQCIGKTLDAGGTAIWLQELPRLMSERTIQTEE